MYKWLMFVLFIGASVFGVVSLIDQVGIHARANAPEVSNEKQLKLVASNFKFDQPEYRVAKGEKTKVSFIIKEGLHAVEIKGADLDIKLDKANPSQEVSFEKPGTYDIMCILPCGVGHSNMNAKLIVE
jgi:cytochrome c oxidase subunit 2